jgi:hypothetical protein
MGRIGSPRHTASRSSERRDSGIEFATGISLVAIAISAGTFVRQITKDRWEQKRHVEVEARSFVEVPSTGDRPRVIGMRVVNQNPPISNSPAHDRLRVRGRCRTPTWSVDRYLRTSDARRGNPRRLPSPEPPMKSAPVMRKPGSRSPVVGVHSLLPADIFSTSVQLGALIWKRRTSCTHRSSDHDGPCDGDHRKEDCSNRRQDIGDRSLLLTWVRISTFVADMRLGHLALRASTARRASRVGSGEVGRLDLPPSGT